MRSKEKKQIITDFLKGLAEKDIHLVELGKFEKELSMWSKKSPQAVSQNYDQCKYNIGSFE